MNGVTYIQLHYIFDFELISSKEMLFTFRVIKRQQNVKNIYLIYDEHI